MEVHSKRVKIGALKQADWATPQGASANYYTMNYDKDTSIIEPAVDVSDFDYTSGSSIHSEEGRMYVNEKTGLKTIAFNSVANINLLAIHLSAFFQNLTEAETTPYAKSVKPELDSPDFYNDEGILHSIAFSPLNAVDGNIADGQILENALLNTLTISYSPAGIGKDSLLKMNGEWIGRKVTPGQDFSGTWVAMPTTGLLSDFGLTALTIGATDLANICLRNAEFSFNNNVTVDCISSDGYAKSYRIQPEMTATFDVPYNSTSMSVLASHKAGSNVAFTFANGDPTQSGKFQIAVTKGVLMENPLVINADYYALRLVVKILKPSAADFSNICSFADAKEWNY